MSAAPLLISCEACGKQFSKKASACPGCANPNDAYSAGSKATTIEQTSKKYKKGIIIGIVCIAFGVAGISTNPTFGGSLLAIGLCTLIWSKMAAWWNNG